MLNGHILNQCSPKLSGQEKTMYNFFLHNLYYQASVQSSHFRQIIKSTQLQNLLNVGIQGNIYIFFVQVIAFDSEI